jgi:uncharacterized protein YbcC (UPF0753/DUF2309 family)
MTVLLEQVADKRELPRNPTVRTIKDMIESAADVISPVWPIKNFIACNPLQGLETLPFEEAIFRAGAYAEAGGTHNSVINRELIKWCGAFLDEGQATIAMPNRGKGFYPTFRELVRFDGNLTCHPDTRAWLGKLPKTPEETIAVCFHRLKIASADQEEFIRVGFAALPGWSGHVKWRTEWQGAASAADNPITLLDLVAVRLVITCVLAPEATVSQIATKGLPVDIASLESNEHAYRTELLNVLMAETSSVGKSAERPKAQLVFCIDVRSEPVRRRIEAQDAYETLGFAGFFGLPVRVKGYDDDEAHDSCPVLLNTSHEVWEHPVDTASVRHHDIGRTLLKLPKSLYQTLKYNFATPFALVEMLGPLCGLRMMLRSFAPLSFTKINRAARQTIMPTVSTRPDLTDIPFSNQVDYGEGALRTMGLTQNFAPLVVFCGHGSSTTNNAYAAALDCGACAGNNGGLNARILAAILNKIDVRSVLATRGLPIPEDTLFVAAEHNTTTDDIVLSDQELEGQHVEAITVLKRDLETAGSHNRLARCTTFGLTVGENDKAEHVTSKRAFDWSETRPEWGLARNAAFIVGPRELTRNVNLEGRAFLHSYDWRSDEGDTLQTILTAPMVVGQWINTQYLFSTLDNTAWGGGSKVTQNVTGKLGVMQGNASDLMHGLPLQSVYSGDNTPYHEPLRLLTVVYAPRHRVHAIIERNPVLQKLFFNGWVNLAVIDPHDNTGQLLERDFTWKTLN